MTTEGESNRLPIARFRPKLLDSLKGYNMARFMKDAMAGLTVGVVALSLCIGLGIASGVSPAAGLYAGIIGGFLVSALGGSKVQIGGPAGAFVGLLALMGAKYGFANLLLCTMMAGVMLFLMGLFKIGSFIKFVPQPVTTGFTCGIAITIFLTQVSSFFGLAIVGEPVEFLPKIIALAKAMLTLDWVTVIIAVPSIIAIWKWPKRWSRWIPGSIVVVIIGTILAGLFGVPVATIGSTFGEIPQGLPKLVMPQFDLDNFNALIFPAFTIAMLGAIESLLSAVVADGLTDDRHDSNQELMAQGVANVVTPLFGGIPVTGVLARTATNIRSGATSPVAGMIHSVFLLLVLLVAAPLASYIPLCCLAAVLMVVAIRMGEWGEFRRLTKIPKSDASVFLITFVLTVCFDLTVAVGIGMLMAAFLFVKRVTDATKVQAMAGESTPSGSNGEKVQLPKGVVLYRVYGVLLFGAADKLDAVIRRGLVDVKVVILNMADVPAMDATALARLESMHAKLRARGQHLILCGPHTQAYFMMAKAGFLDVVSMDNVCSDFDESLERAKELIGEKAATPNEAESTESPSA